MMKAGLYLSDEWATVALGERLGAHCRGGERLWVSGELGAGKTTLIRGVALGLGISRGVKSPTFQLLREYRGRLTLYHADLYRFEPGEDPTAELGLDELPGPAGVLAVEWAERAPHREGGLLLRLEFKGTGRSAALEAADPDHLHLLTVVEQWDG